MSAAGELVEALPAAATPTAGPAGPAVLRARTRVPACGRASERFWLDGPDSVGTLTGPDGTVSIAIVAGELRGWLTMTTAEALALAPELVDAATLVEHAAAYRPGGEDR